MAHPAQFDDWVDAECFALSDQMYNFADADFSGIVDIDETLAVRKRLAEFTGTAFDEAACKRKLMGEAQAEGASNDPEQPVQQKAWNSVMRTFLEEVGAEAFKKAAKQTLSSPPPGPPRIVVGPIVGKVTETTARIMVECSHDAEVQCTLSVAGAAARAHKRKLKAGVPRAFAFTELEAGTQYEVSFEGAEVLVSECAFRTVPKGGWRLGSAAPPKFAVASCNKVYVSRQLKRGSPADLWRDLETRLRGGERIDYMLHLGDNVYNDSEWFLIEKGKKALEGQTCKWGIAVNWLSKLPPERWEERRSDILRLFQSAYRETWGHPPTRYVLANVPNIMLFDDHDIRDDWGDREEDNKVGTVDYWLGRVCYDVINIYQRQLMEDISSPPTEDFHLHAFGDVGFMFVDVRGCKTFHMEKDDPSPFLGTKQWRALEDAMRDEGAFGQCKALLALMPVPIAYVTETPTMVAGRTICDDLLGQWSATKHKAEVPRFLDLLLQWRNKRKSRDVLIIGGDVHEGGWTDIFESERNAYLRQLTTSAIANKMTLHHEALAVTLTRDAAGCYDGFRLCGNWKSRHYDWTNQRNYALVDINGGRHGTLEVTNISAKGLRNADAGYSFLRSGDKSDPYVVLQVGNGETQKTTTINDDLDPVWKDERFKFHVFPRQHTLKLKLFDHDLQSKDDPLGKAYLEFRQLEPGKPLTQTLNVQDGTGTITVQVQFTPSTEELPDGLEAIIGAQLIASNGQQVKACKRRTTGDDAKAWYRQLGEFLKEAGGHSMNFAKGLSSTMTSKLSATLSSVASGGYPKK